MSKHKLLLADDSITIQKVVNLTFADEGVEVVSVSDGNTAIEKLAEFMPDLIMADINMPGLNGYQICEHIRQTESTRGIPVILLVGSFEPFDEDEARRVGANDYLTKPFQSIRQLVTKVNGLFESASNAQTNATDEIVSELETPQSSQMPGEFEDTLEMKPEEPAIENFGDAGMDDEMIQTSQVAGFGLDEMPKFQSHTEIETNDSAITQPLTSAEFNEIHGFESSEQAVTEEEVATESSNNEESAYSFTGDPITANETSIADEEEISPTADTEPFSPPVSFYQTQESAVESNTALDLDEGNLLELPQRETSSAVMNEPVWQEDVASLDQSFEPNVEIQEGTAELNQFSPVTEEFRETVNEKESEAVYDETGTAETGKETVSEIALTEAETAGTVETNQTETSETEEISSEEIAETGEKDLISELPPQVIEAIAAKVSERFSDRIIREIVAEVTPQITELIARRIAEENPKE